MTTNQLTRYMVTPVTSRWVLTHGRAAWLCAHVPRWKWPGGGERTAYFSSAKPFGYRVVIEDHWPA